MFTGCAAYYNSNQSNTILINTTQHDTMQYDTALLSADVEKFAFRLVNDILTFMKKISLEISIWYSE